MNNKILGFGFVIVMLLSAWFFLGDEKILSKNSAAPVLETPSSNSAKSVLVSDSVISADVMKPSSEANSLLDNQSDSTKKSPGAEPSESRESDFRSLLASEGKLVVKSGTGENPGELYLNSSLLMPVLSEDGAFDELLENFLSDQLGSADAMDIANAYTDIFEAYGESMDDEMFNLQNFSCGHSICIGSVFTGNSDETWADFQAQLQAEGGVIRVFMENPVFIDDETVEHRFFFSIDPNLVGMMFSENG